MSVVEGRRRYRCRNRVKGDQTPHVGRDATRLDDYVDALVVAGLSDPDLLALMTPTAEDFDLTGLRSEHEAARLRLDEAAQMFAAGTIDAAQLATISASGRATRSDRGPARRRRASESARRDQGGLLEAVDVADPKARRRS
ncbi:MAG TPA: hypothetical protein VIW24_30275 [Aldersonia sp.]